MKNTRYQKGITLVALIITIIVLLILAVVAISAVSGDGIIEHAKDASLKTKIAQEEEKIRLAVQESYMSNLGKINYAQIATILGEGYTIQEGICTTPTGNKIKIEANGNVSSLEELKVNAEGSLFTFEYNDETKTASITGFNSERVKGTVFWGYYSSYEYLMDENGNKLTTIDIPATVVYNGTEYTVSKIQGLYMMVSGTFTYLEDTNVTTVNIPTTITEIGGSCFESFTNLRTVNMYYANTDIAPSAFQRTPWLASKYNENGLWIEGTVLVSGVNAKGDITIPNSVISIGNNAFNGCTELETITIPNSVISIGNNAFGGCSELETITIPNSVTSIGDSAFAGCTALEIITIPNSVISMGSSAFYDCTSLTTIVIPNSVTTLGSYAFSNCSSLSSITLSNSITNIGENTFFGCSALTEITIPTNVTDIGFDAFRNCKNLVTISNMPENLTDDQIIDMFFGSYLSNGGVSMQEQITPWFDNKCVIKEEKFLTYNDILIWAKDAGGEITIPNGVKRIYKNAFFYMGNITKLSIPSSVDIIDEGSLYGSFAGIESIIINKIENSIPGAPWGAKKSSFDSTPPTITWIGN